MFFLIDEARVSVRVTLFLFLPRTALVLRTAFYGPRIPATPFLCHMAATIRREDTITRLEYPNRESDVQEIGKHSTAVRKLDGDDLAD